MKRWPLIPTLIVAGAVLTMIALGIWQLRRAAWKESLLAQYAAAETKPAVDLDPLLAHAALPPLSFRRALVTCAARDAEPDVHAGRSGGGDRVGQVYVIPCRPGAEGLAGRIRINAGWAERPDAVRRLSLSGIVAGRLSVVEPEGPILLTAATPSPPLAASAPASIESVPNNHLAYAFQWFFFASAAAVIYVLALRGRRRDLPAKP